MGTAEADLFRQAEAAFTGGRAEQARQALLSIGKVSDPAVLHLTALVEKKLGNVAAARTAFEEALRRAPCDPMILSNYGNLLDAAGDIEAALQQQERAIAIAPSFANARFARALLLQRLGRAEAALAELDLLVESYPAEARFFSARGKALREVGDLAGAAEAFDRSLALDPGRAIALHGRARVALERGEPESVAFFAAALQKGVGGAEVHLGYAQALEAEGRAEEAISHLGALLKQKTDWSEGQATLARIRWEAGDHEQFASELEALARSSPGQKEAWHALIAVLAGADLFARAADAAMGAAAAHPDDLDFRLLAALHRSQAGDLESADRLFASLPAAMPERDHHEASHQLRCGRYAQALLLLDKARARQPTSVAAWALTSAAWRLTGDPRAAWLNDQPGLVTTMSLGFREGELESIAACLRGLHRTRARPLGQSLRGGTQTRGRLFEREEPELRRLRDAIVARVEDYWQALPRADPDHPLLRHRALRPALEGSWSVRLTSGGFHVAHFHSNGVVSSATYMVLPAPSAPMEGWLEIGGAPANLNLPLEPLHRVEPQVGLMALFPSYLFHGTRPFAEGERLTAAFDIVPR